MRRALCWLAVLWLPAGSAWAVTKTAVANDLWSLAATWSPSGQPAAADDIVIDNDSPILDAAATCAGGASACGQSLSLSANTSLILGRGTTSLWINCAGTADPCISNAGTIIMSAGQTLKIGSNEGGTAGNKDRVRTLSGGRLVVEGRVLARGNISSVITDEATVSNPSRAFGLPTRNFVFEDSSASFLLTAAGAQVWASADDCVANCYVVRFTSGERKGRWYNVIASTTNPTTRITVDFDSRRNPACVGGSDATCGIGLGATGKADGYGPAYTTGTAAVSSQTVTGTGTAWVNAIALGSRWYCTAGGDGPDDGKRVIRVASGTSLILESAYAGAGCAATAAYRLVDENQPYPFTDHSEHIKPGDSYEILQPATIQGAVITTGAEPDGATRADYTNVDCRSGSACLFRNAVVKWTGAVTGAAADADNGVFLENPDGQSIMDSEFMGFACPVFVLVYDADNFTFARNFVHYFAPTLGALGDGHGIMLTTATFPQVVQSGNKILDNRFELTNDDPVWARAAQSGWRETSNIFKYIGATTTADTSNCTEWGGFLGFNPGGTHYFRDVVASDNICMNVGSTSFGNGEFPQYGSSAGFTWRTQGATGGTGYRTEIGIARNIVANVQDGSGISWEGSADAADTNAEWLTNQVTVAGNYISNVAWYGIGGAQNAYNNLVVAWGLDRSNSDASGIVFVPKNARGNITIPVDESVATPAWANAGSTTVGMRQIPDLLGVNVNIGYSAAPLISDNALFGHGAAMFVGGTGCGGMKANPQFTINNNWISCDLNRNTPNSNVIGIDQWRGGSGENSEAITFNIISGCSNGGIFKRSCATPPTPTESSNFIVGTTVPTVNFSIDASDSTTRNLGWSPLSFAFDRQTDLAASQGPRSVGLAINPTWHMPHQVGLAGTLPANARDSDGDGISDLFDSKPRTWNPVQN